MTAKKRRPTRRDLLIVIERLQLKIGRAIAANGDRNPDRNAQVMGALNEAHNLCIEARRYDPLFRATGPWVETGPDREYI